MESKEQLANRVLAWKDIKNAGVETLTDSQKKGIYDCHQLVDEGTVKYQTMRKNLIRFIVSGLEDDYKERMLRLTEYLNNRGTALTEELMIIQYGDEFGKERWKSYLERQRYTNTLEYKSSKYGMTEDEFTEYNRNRAVTLDNLIEKHGEVKGTKRWKSYVERQRYTNTLEYFIEKYGEKRGREHWKAVNKLKRHNMENYVRLYGDQAEQRLRQFHMRTGQFYSPVSQEFAEMMENKLCSDWKVYYALKTGEYAKNFNGVFYCYDFVCLLNDNKICIEYNGDLFHANPRMFEENDCPNFYCPELTAKEIWEADRIKQQCLIDIGFHVMVVWDEDFKADKKGIVDTCINEIERIINENN